MDLAGDITSEDLEVFLQEADEQLQLLDEDIVRLEREHGEEALLQEIFRAAHTLKGSSAMVGHQPMANLAHGMESLLDRVRKGSLEVTTQVVDALLHSLDLMKTMKEDLAGSQDGNVDISGAVAELKAAEQAGLAAGESQPEEKVFLVLDREASARMQRAAEGNRGYLVEVSISKESSWAAIRCFQVLEALSQLGEVVGSAPAQEEIEAEKVGFEIQVALASEEDEESMRSALAGMDDITHVEVGPYINGVAVQEVEKADPSQAKNGQRPQTLRVDVERLDYLMNTIGELVIDRTRILQISRMLEVRYKDDELVEALGETSGHVVKVVDELQEEIMKVRMQPIGAVFSGFPRMVRDLAQKFNKSVDFVVEGQDTEVDRSIVERLRDPLMHLLRNSVDHGLELPEVRRETGKPETGVLRLSAYHEQGHIVITVEDDGRGIDSEVVRKAAVSKGLISPEAVSRLTDAEAIDLIFMPGASTAEKTTEVSGRGVGMDIVKTNIEAINGFVTADTKVGKGTKFTLMLPLTLATLQALLVSVDNTVYAVPVIYVLETVRVEPEEIQTIEGKEIIRLRDSMVPVLRLKRVLNHDSIGTGEDGTTYVVVVRIGERLVGLAVDQLMELQEIMVKSLGQFMGDVKGIAGASILGDGKIVLIMDVPTLVHTSITRGRLDLPGAAAAKEAKEELAAGEELEATGVLAA